MPDVPNNREGPQARESCKCLNRQSYGEGLAKELFWSPAIRGSKKDSVGPITAAAEAVRVPAHLAPLGSPWPKQLRHLHVQPSLGHSCHKQKESCIYACEIALAMSNSLWPCGLWPARLLCQRGFSRQEYWSVLAKTGCHTLLDHYISCWSSRQLLWVPGASRTPVTQALAPPPHLALTGADSSPPGQLQEQIPVDNPHAEVEIKPQLKPRSSVAKEEDPNPSPKLYKLQIKSTWSARQTLCLWNI